MSILCVNGLFLRIQNLSRDTEMITLNLTHGSERFDVVPAVFSYKYVDIRRAMPSEPLILLLESYACSLR